MVYIIEILVLIFSTIGRLLFFLKDIWNIFKFNFLFIVHVLQTLPSYTYKIISWLFGFVTLLPGRIAEGGLIELARWINLAVASSCCGFLADAVKFPDMLHSPVVHGMAYFAFPFRLEYGFACVLCALFIRFILKSKSFLPVGKLPRVPLPNWPKLPGSGG